MQKDKFRSMDESRLIQELLDFSQRLHEFKREVREDFASIDRRLRVIEGHWPAVRAAVYGDQEFSHVDLQTLDQRLQALEQFVEPLRREKEGLWP